ncbi:hypothetical protein BWP19_00800 [Stenotrophomonas maltophilia]|nr:MULTISPECIES: hypothetical protein [Stenotrophomonas]OMP40927.1 hypothetical protein BMR86_04535 [Stenotrophomonas sp. KAs 5-3]AIL06513.1 hypothetical protein DP16_3456 [Stenotrophomonas maltophilia]OMO42165.1 hypothetical protein BU225_05065 [Stenotrophomonas sp. MB339]OOD20046.1 hypothetical protein BWP19_00800 [Stenotrophomonas maltophilia]SNW04822.1 Uncharacterised protein [Stenotrophomonas maltophilia]
MTQQQKSPPRTLPACAAGHKARYIHDLRREGAGGGHLIECRCSTTAKHPSFDLAWAHWHKQHGLQVVQPATPLPAPAPQLQLRLVGGTG